MNQENDDVPDVIYEANGVVAFYTFIDECNDIYNYYLKKLMEEVSLLNDYFKSNHLDKKVIEMHKNKIYIYGEIIALAKKAIDSEKCDKVMEVMRYAVDAEQSIECNYDSLSRTLAKKVGKLNKKVRD